MQTRRQVGMLTLRELSLHAWMIGTAGGKISLVIKSANLSDFNLIPLYLHLQITKYRRRNLRFFVKHTMDPFHPVA